MHFLKIALPLLAVIFAVCASAEAATTIAGYIGSHKLSFSMREIATVATFDITGPADYLAITEVYPDTPTPVEYFYRVEAPGIGTYERRHTGTGFGPETFFTRVSHNPIGTVRVTNLGKEPLRISRVWGVTKAELDSLLAKDNFRILGTTKAGSDDGEELVEQIAKGMRPAPEFNITTGFSAEIRYANQPPERVRAAIENCAEWSRKYSLQAMIGLVSWWSGTPGRMPDRQGGLFGDIKYQQICYTPEIEQPEDPELKALLGDRYDRHYCLSKPNQWASTPWLTMNSKVLNDYRYKRLTEAAAALKDVCGGNTKWIDNFYLENEPRYWDTRCEAANNKRTPAEMWADFNPLAVESAKKDGVELDPRDGLSDKELLWLFRNVGAYNQEVVDVANKALAANGFGIPVYTHSLQHRDMFPGGSINHPASEWAYAKGARTGVEGMWSQPSDFTRLREWGRWANVNREECDGRHIDEHLWDLRVAYMMGADLYNSYNWSRIGEGRFFGYVKEFLDNLPVVTLPAAGVQQISIDSIRMQSPISLQAFSGIKIPANVTKQIKGLVRLTVTNSAGSLIGMSSIPVDLEMGQPLPAFDFAEPVLLDRKDSATVKLQALDSKGKPIAGAVEIALDPASPVGISLDLRTQRALSLAVIARSSPNPQP